MGADGRLPRSRVTEPVRRRPRALLLFTDVYANGGIQRFNRTLLAALTELDIDCEVLSMNDTRESIDRARPADCLHVTGFAGNRLRFSMATLRAVWRERYEWIVIGHINLLTMSMMALLTRPFARPRSYLITHGIEVWYRIGFGRRASLARVDSILCVSDYTRRRILVQVPALAPDRLSIFPNALSNTWAGKLVPRKIRETPDKFLLSVTRLEKGDRYKGIVTVIEALSMLVDDSMHYVVVGQGGDVAFLRLVAQHHGVSHRVQFLSGISDDEMVSLYETCEAFVLPSGKEGFGIVFLEAMFFGAPVIAAAEKGALDVIRDGESGLLVRFGDSMAVRRAIERLGSDPALRERLRRTGRESVMADGSFTFVRFVERSAGVLGLRRVLAA
jgi:phosphatidyl-myo-inositol dimannoside synthase